MSTETSSTIDLTETPRAECETRLKSGLSGLETGDSARVVANHNPERVLEEYEDERGFEVNWEVEQDGPEEWSIRVTKGGRDDFEVFDVTAIPPQERHKDILARFTNMDVGDGFVLVNDHDPKPLFYELRSIHGETFDWEYRKKEPGECRVRIEKTGESRDLPEHASTRVDVRRIPPEDRHAAIFHRFDLLAPGDAMEIVADHDPQPLRHQFREMQGDAFEWEYLEKEPNLCRVLLTKTEESDGEEQAEDSKETTDVDTEGLSELDVREYPPAERHRLIFDRYEELDDGDAFVLVNDHDPKPLYYQMKEEMAGGLRWEYVRQDEGEWKVLIGKQ
jgi:uncharacterized protein (DUF2249 family)